MHQTLYLHIGFHKTGTSALQESFHNKREKLYKNNIFYPDPLSEFPSHQELAWALYDKPPPWADKEYRAEEVYDHYISIIKNNNKANNILSSEDISSLDNNRNAMEFIKEQFSDFKVKIIAYVREPKDFLLSLYHHRVRAGIEVNTFKEYLANQVKLDRANFARRLEVWKDIFGYENLIVKKYSSEIFENGTIANDFLDILGMKKLNIKTPKSNVGIHPWVNELYRNLIKSSEINEEKRKKIFIQLQEIGQKLPKIIGYKYYLEDNDIKILDRYYETHNFLLRQKYKISF